MPDLILTAAEALTQSGRRRTGNKSSFFQFPVEWWEFHDLEQATHFVTTFKMPGGGKLNFAMEKSVIPRMIEVLQSMIGKGPVVPPAKNQN